MAYLTKLPEFPGLKLQHRDAGFVHERRRGVPRLDLLAEQDLHVRELAAEERKDGGVDRVEHLG